MDEERERVVTFDGVIALLLGLISLGFGIVLVLRPVHQGFLIAPIGAGAALFGVRGLRGPGRGRALPILGLVTGAAGAVLIVVGLVLSAFAP
jgi:hypothetical protein